MDEVEGLIQQLKDPDTKARWRVIEALVRIGKPAVPALIDALKDESAEARGWAAYTLGNIGDVRAVEPLIEALEDDSGHVRVEAYRALGTIGDPRAVPILIDGLGCCELYYMRRNTAEALGDIAKKADVDLGKVRASLQEVVKREKDPEERKKTRKWAVRVYTKIAKTVSKRKKAEMPGEMPKDTLPAKIKPPKKKDIYRTRRVANG